ncbi:MAG: hypothetical protein HOV83_37960 [Catenulispora sp.]|nr:hypothetical protein [Catenulispora sp.]
MTSLRTPGAGAKARTGTKAVSVTVALSGQTVRALTDADFKLSAFHGVSCAEGGGAALVWAQTATFTSPSIALMWNEDYSAYGSTLTPPSASSSAVIVGTDTVPAAFGQAFDVGPHAVLTPDSPGYPGVIALQNTTSTPFTSGISLPAPIGTPAVAPICAFPLYGNNSVYIGPSPNVLLMFATPPFAVGTPVRRPYGPTVAVDISISGAVNLRYDINAGWSGDSPFVPVDSPEQFVSLLIVAENARRAGIRG